MVIVALSFALHDNPPSKTSAASQINNPKQVVKAVQPLVAKPVEAPKPVEVQTVEAPVPAVTPAPKPEVASVHPSGCANYQHIIDRYNWNKQVIAAICHAESGGNPYAVGDTRVIGGIYAPSCGLFQIRTLAGRPSCEQLKDPETNIAWAHRIYSGQGLSAWSVCKTKVRCY